MTGIKIVCVGRVKEDFFRDGIAAYVKEIRKKYSMDIMECPDEPTPDQCPLLWKGRFGRWKASVF